MEMVEDLVAADDDEAVSGQIKLSFFFFPYHLVFIGCFIA